MVEGANRLMSPSSLSLLQRSRGLWNQPPCERELLLTPRDGDSANERRFLFFFLLPARANTAAAVKHCGEGELSRRLSLYLCLPQLCESLLLSGSCFLSFTLFSFLPHFPSCSHSCCPRGSMLFSDHPGGGGVRLREENKNIRHPLFFFNGRH